MSDPRWLTAARQQIGQKEIPGRQHNPRILQWWGAIRAPFTDDETPWCAAFVGGMLESVGIKSTRSAAARSYTNYGTRLVKPVVGCIVVFSRGPRNGHVGFYVGRDQRGNLLILGGNQGDAVNIKPFSSSRVLAYRWPPGEPITSRDRVEENYDPVSRRESFMSQPDDPGTEPDEEGERKPFLQRAKNWIFGGGAGILSSLYDWRVALVIVGAGLIVFLILLYTKRI